MLPLRLSLTCVTMRSGCSFTQVFLTTPLCLPLGRSFSLRTRSATGRQCISLATWSLSTSWSLVLLRSWLVLGRHSRLSTVFSHPLHHLPPILRCQLHPFHLHPPHLPQVLG